MDCATTIGISISQKDDLWEIFRIEAETILGPERPGEDVDKLFQLWMAGYNRGEMSQAEKDKKEIETLEIQLGEAQQWIDSEPDWKAKYNENYQKLMDLLKSKNEQLQNSDLEIEKFREDAVQMLTLLRDAYDIYMGPDASGDFTCDCGLIEQCGPCELKIRFQHFFDKSETSKNIKCPTCGNITKYMVKENEELTWYWCNNCKRSAFHLNETRDEK